MRMFDLIQKKKRGIALETSEIQFLLSGLLSGEIPDYQVSAFSGRCEFRPADGPAHRRRPGPGGRCAPARGPGERRASPGADAHAFTPVSYTHLDVYKRQSCKC